jgi:hypothetical protein
VLELAADATTTAGQLAALAAAEERCAALLETAGRAAAALAAGDAAEAASAAPLNKAFLDDAEAIAAAVAGVIRAVGEVKETAERRDTPPQAQQSLPQR